jgi:hypothetical protein
MDASAIAQDGVPASTPYSWITLRGQPAAAVICLSAHRLAGRGCATEIAVLAVGAHGCGL